MSKLTLAILVCTYSYSIQAQFCVQNIEGIYFRSDSSTISEFKGADGYVSIKIFRNGKLLPLEYYPNISEPEGEIFISQVRNFGFLNIDHYSYCGALGNAINRGESEVQEHDIELCGECFISFNNDNFESSIIVTDRFDMGSNSIELGSHWSSWFIKIDNLPYYFEQELFELQKIDSIDYFQEFFGAKVTSICVDQLDVFDEIDGDNMGYLVKDDLVEVIEEQGDWVQVKYLKTDQVYWTYMSCLE